MRTKREEGKWKRPEGGLRKGYGRERKVEDKRKWKMNGESE